MMHASYNKDGHIISAGYIQNTILGCRLPPPGQVQTYTPKSVFQELEVPKEEYMHKNFKIQKRQNMVFPKLVDIVAKVSETMVEELDEQQRQQVMLDVVVVPINEQATGGSTPVVKGGKGLLSKKEVKIAVEQLRTPKRKRSQTLTEEFYELEQIDDLGITLKVPDELVYKSSNKGDGVNPEVPNKSNSSSSSSSLNSKVAVEDISCDEDEVNEKADNEMTANVDVEKDTKDLDQVEHEVHSMVDAPVKQATSAALRPPLVDTTRKRDDHDMLHDQGRMLESFQDEVQYERVSPKITRSQEGERLQDDKEMMYEGGSRNGFLRSQVIVAKKIKELNKKDELTITDIKGVGLEMLKSRYKNDVKLEYHVDQIKAVMGEEAQRTNGIVDIISDRWSKEVHLYHVDALNGIHHWDAMRKDFFKAEMSNRSTHKVYYDKRIITFVVVGVEHHQQPWQPVGRRRRISREA
uniref:Uncharacterized protein n=1 Tax=Tanacetum cinerariifolium TaxID=118510 RepID=A0A6L2MIW7_TANCI|nr:hypothetical protein [Tanacetum cinerariifolium]